MRTDRMRQSTNIEDRRGRTPRIAVGGGLGGLILVIIIILLGGNPMQLLNQMGSPSGGGGGGLGGGPVISGGTIDPAQQAQVELVRSVLGDTEDVWHELFRGEGRTYVEPTLVLFSDRVESACGIAGSATGPFYCPADQKVYVDLAFYDELRARFGAPGDFAQAYVLAHEIGHHVQALTGIERDVRARQQRSPERANDLSVRMELQADCLAGVWGHQASSRGVLEDGDIEEGLRAAAAIGDDRIQKMSGRGVHPESFTHGTSAQRQEWFQRGLESGRPDGCDTFRQ